MYYKAKEMLQKARQPKHGGSKIILDRGHKDDKYCKSLSDFGWTEEHIILGSLRLHRLNGCSTIGGRAKFGILSHLHPGLNSSEFFSFRDALFACRKLEFPGNRPGVKTDTHAARHIFTCTVTPQTTQHR